MINLDNILNGYNCFVEDGLGFMEYSLGRVDEDFVNEYGYGKKDDLGNYLLQLTRFDLMKLDKDDLSAEGITDDLRELNSSISSFFDICIDFPNAHLQVHQTYNLLFTIGLTTINNFLIPMKPRVILQNLTVPKDLILKEQSAECSRLDIYPYLMGAVIYSMRGDKVHRCRLISVL